MMEWFSGAPALDALSDQALAAKHEQLQKHIKLLRIAIPLATFLVIAGTLLHIRATFAAIDGTEVAVAFEKQAQRVLPKVQKAAMEVGDDVAPMVGDAFASQLDGAFERLAGRLDSEMTQLGDTLPEQLEKQLQRKLEAANEGAAAKLFEAFPELRKDPKRVERLMAAFQNGFSTWAGKTLTGTFARHLKELENIKATLNGFVVAQNQAERANEAAAADAGQHKAKTKITPDQLLALWLEILDEALKGDGDSDLFTAPVEDAAPAKAAK